MGSHISTTLRLFRLFFRIVVACCVDRKSLLAWA